MANKKKEPPQSIRTRKFKSKSDILKEKIKTVCEHYQMHADFEGSMVYVTTVVGEWYFNYNDRPIRLRHKNSEVRYDNYGRTKGHYHLQPQSFNAPLHALSYISHHEQAEIRRLMFHTLEPIKLQELLRQMDCHLLMQFIKLEYGISEEDEIEIQQIYDKLIDMAPTEEMEDSTILVAFVHKPEQGGERGYEGSYLLPSDIYPRAIATANLPALLTMKVSRTSISLYGPVAVAASILYTIWTPTLSGEEQIKKSYRANKSVYEIMAHGSSEKNTPKE